MVTGHQQPDPRVGRPGRESNPVCSLSQGEPDIESQGAARERSRWPEMGCYSGTSQGESVIVRRGLRAPSARR
jgi:hypothetical protein